MGDEGVAAAEWYLLTRRVAHCLSNIPCMFEFNYVWRSYVHVYVFRFMIRGFQFNVETNITSTKFDFFYIINTEKYILCFRYCASNINIISLHIQGVLERLWQLLYRFAILAFMEINSKELTNEHMFRVAKLWNICSEKYASDEYRTITKSKFYPLANHAFCESPSDQTFRYHA